MIRLNEMYKPAHLEHLYRMAMYNAISENIMGGMWCPPIKNSESLLSGFLGRDVLMTSSGTNALLASIWYSESLATKPIRYVISRKTYFSLVSYFLGKDVVIYEDVQEFSDDHFHIVVLTNHSNENAPIGKLPLHRFVIEDRCLVFGIQSFGLADIECYSFSNNKLIVAGEGGCIASTPSIIQKLRLKSFGNILPKEGSDWFMYTGEYSVEKSENPIKSSSNACVAILIENQLKNIAQNIEKRAQNARFLGKYLDISLKSDVFLYGNLAIPKKSRISRIRRLQKLMFSQGLQTSIGLLPYEHYTGNEVEIDTLYIPCHSMLSDNDLETIVRIVTKYV